MAQKIKEGDNFNKNQIEVLSSALFNWSN